MNIREIKTEILNAITDFLPNSTVSFDFADTIEAESGAVIKDISFTYVNDFEIHEQITATFSVLLIAKGDDTLFTMINELSEINGNEGDKYVRWYVVEHIDLLGSDDANKYAQVFINCNVSNQDQE
jgi:hypothetical protein